MPSLPEKHFMDIATSLVTNLGVLGALVWYLYYTTAVAIPRIVKDHDKAIKETTDNFTQALKEERLARKEELETLKEWIKSEASCRYNRDHYS
jgi:hypothetical protein